MRLIKSHVEIWEQEPGVDGMFRQIERVGRVCYKSEDKIGPGTAEKFVGMLKKAEHNKALEQGTVYLETDQDFYKTNPYTVVREGKYVTTNYRVLLENNRLADLDLWSYSEGHHEKRITAHFICDRGVSAELNRHTTNSAMEMSTRYCNFSRSKFSESIGVIVPSDIDPSLSNFSSPDYDVSVMYSSLSRGDGNSWSVVDWWFFANLSCEIAYMNLIRLGWKPQQARRVLPLDLQTELCHTTTVSGWKHFFDLRCDKIHAHPDMYILATELYDKMSVMWR